MVKPTIASTAAILLCALLYSFVVQRSISDITTEDVTLKIPKRFPAPVYNFSNNRPTPLLFSLGRKLFYDPILSKDSTISCATCHKHIAAFSDAPFSLSKGISGLTGTRNAPALQNLIWYNSFMWDGGVNHLEVQPISPITNHVEMDETMAGIISKLQRNNNYRAAFNTAYGDTVINSERMLKALTQFIGLIISANSRYDRFVNNTGTLTPDEEKGMQLFRDKCANCHHEPLFTDNRFRNNGLMPDSMLKDKGRAAITGLQFDEYKFKVPSLRNVSLTPPYMHDGRFNTLNEVMEHYSNPKKFAPNTAKEMYEIGRLSPTDKKNIILFLNTLTDSSFVTDKRFSEPD